MGEYEYERQTREERQQAATVYVPTTLGLTGSVGTSASRWVMNANADQRLLIELLAGITTTDGGKREEWTILPPAGSSGRCNPVLAEAIWDFQYFWKEKGIFRNIDGVVDPGGNTIKKMTELISRQSPVVVTSTMSALAEKDKDTSLRWAMAATQNLSMARKFYEANLGPIRKEFQPRPLRIVLEALEAHFHFSTLVGPQTAAIDLISSSYGKTMNILLQSANYFIDDTTSEEADKGTPAHVPMCRAAMVLHEPFHITNHPLASAGQCHVHEGDSKYALNPAANQVNNPHSYACFAQHCYFGIDTRFGIGRASE